MSRRSQRADKMRRLSAAVDRPAAGPFDWLTSADDAEFRAWVADMHPISTDTYRRLPLPVRIRLAKLTDPDAF